MAWFGGAVAAADLVSAALAETNFLAEREGHLNGEEKFATRESIRSRQHARRVRSPEPVSTRYSNLPGDSSRFEVEDSALNRF